MGTKGSPLGPLVAWRHGLNEGARSHPCSLLAPTPPPPTGFFGIDQAQCEARGCCWGPTHARVQVAATGSEEGHGQGQAGTQAHGAGWADVPWCFRPNGPVESYLVTAVQATGKRGGEHAPGRLQLASRGKGWAGCMFVINTTTMALQLGLDPCVTLAAALGGVGDLCALPASLYTSTMQSWATR